MTRDNPARFDVVDSEATAPDGSPVAVYRSLPEGDEAALIHAAVPARASVLDLGCGVGRIARGLARRGHSVTGVDNEPAMLKELPEDVEGVLGDVASIRLSRRFDVVLLASHFLNDVEPTAFLETARRHAEPNGSLVAQVYPPGTDWATRIGQAHLLGDVEVTLVRADDRDGLVDAEVRYRLGRAEWRQPFVARVRDEGELGDELRSVGFAWGRWIDEQRGWLLARAVALHESLR